MAGAAVVQGHCLMWVPTHELQDMEWEYTEDEGDKMDVDDEAPAAAMAPPLQLQLKQGAITMDMDVDTDVPAAPARLLAAVRMERHAVLLLGA